MRWNGVLLHQSRADVDRFENWTAHYQSQSLDLAIAFDSGTQVLENVASTRGLNINYPVDI